MPTSGTTFTDWEQLETGRHRPLLVDEDFSWSDSPGRRRRARQAVATVERTRWIESEHEDEPINVERELDGAWGGRLSAPAAQTHEVAPYSFALGGEAAPEPTGRRTVVITGRGAERYPASRRRAGSALAFHQRSGFGPDRMAMWAVLLGIALLLGSIAH
jgi:hypothetical protein